MKRLGRLAGAISMALTICLGSASEAVAGKGGGKPDLVISGAKVGGKEYAFRSEPLDLEVGVDTRNEGKAKAGRSVTGAYLSRDGDKYGLDSRTVPALRPGKVDSPPSHTVSRSDDYPAGGYAIVVCADVTGQVKESNENNNCGRVKKAFDSFYSTYRDWAGVVSGTGYGLGGPVFPNLHESWTSSGTGTEVAYTFKGYGSPGKFKWTLQSGAVKYSHSGSVPPSCTSVTGSGTVLLETGHEDLAANYDTEAYAAQAVAIPGAAYPIIGTCHGGAFYGGSGPVHLTTLYTGRRRLPFDTKELKGTIASPIEQATSNTWSLTGR